MKMKKYYYCPICGTIQQQTNSRCIRCHTRITMAETLYDDDYYRQQSELIYGDRLHWENIIESEASTNPLYSQEVHDRAKRELDKEFDKIIGRIVSNQNNSPKCPTCGSTNISKISNLRRGIHGATFGLFSKTARSQFECKNCGYKW